MEIGDIISIVIFGIIALSFFSGVLDRRESKEERPARPTELSQSGGLDRQPQVEPSGETDLSEELAEERRTIRAERQERRAQRSPTVTYEDPVEAGDLTRSERRREDVRERSRQRAAQQDDRLVREEIRERGPSLEGLVTEEGGRRRPRPRPVAARRRHPATGGDVLRRSLKDPDTLERAFIIKEVLDLPVGLRPDS